MRLSSADKARKFISLVVILLLSAVYYGSFDVALDEHVSGGSIRGCSGISIPHSLLAVGPAAVREDNENSSGQGQSIDKTAPSADIFSRIVRKLLQILSGTYPSESVIHFRLYFLSLCIAGCAYLYFLALIRCIHLKDGSK